VVKRDCGKRHGYSLGSDIREIQKPRQCEGVARGPASAAAVAPDGYAVRKREVGPSRRICLGLGLAVFDADLRRLDVTGGVLPLIAARSLRARSTRRALGAFREMLDRLVLDRLVLDGLVLDPRMLRRAGARRRRATGS